MLHVMLASVVQYSAPVTHTHTVTLFKTLFPYRPLQSTEYSSQCYTAGPY